MKAFSRLVLLVIVVVTATLLAVVAGVLPGFKYTSATHHPTIEVLDQASNIVPDIPELPAAGFDKNADSQHIDKGSLSLAIDALVAMSSDTLIEYGLSLGFGYDQVSLTQLTDKKYFAANLLKRGLLKDKDTAEDDANNSQLLPIKFIASGNASNVSNNNVKDNNASQDFFYPSLQMMRAHFSTQSYASNRVLVRWIAMDTQQLISFAAQTILPYTDDTHVWLRRDYWPPGDYQVDIFAEDDALTSIATGRFTVSYPVKLVSLVAVK